MDENARLVEAPASNEKEKDIRRAIRTLMEREGWDFTVNERLDSFEATFPWREEEAGTARFVILGLINRKDTLRIYLFLEIGEISGDVRPELIDLLWTINQVSVASEKEAEFIFHMKSEIVFLEGAMIFKEDAATPEKIFRKIGRAKVWFERYEYAIAAVLKGEFKAKRAFESAPYLKELCEPVGTRGDGRNRDERLLIRMMKNDGQADVHKFHPKRIFSAAADHFGVSLGTLCGKRKEPRLQYARKLAVYLVQLSGIDEQEDGWARRNVGENADILRDKMAFTSSPSGARGSAWRDAERIIRRCGGKNVVDVELALHDEEKRNRTDEAVRTFFKDRKIEYEPIGTFGEYRAALLTDFLDCDLRLHVEDGGRVVLSAWATFSIANEQKKRVVEAVGRWNALIPKGVLILSVKDKEKGGWRVCYRASVGGYGIPATKEAVAQAVDEALAVLQESAPAILLSMLSKKHVDGIVDERNREVERQDKEERTAAKEAVKDFLKEREETLKRLEEIGSLYEGEVQEAIFSMSGFNNYLSFHVGERGHVVLNAWAPYVIAREEKKKAVVAIMERNSSISKGELTLSVNDKEKGDWRVCYCTSIGKYGIPATKERIAQAADEAQEILLSGFSEEDAVVSAHCEKFVPNGTSPLSERAKTAVERFICRRKHWTLSFDEESGETDAVNWPVYEGQESESEPAKALFELSLRFRVKEDEAQVIAELPWDTKGDEPSAIFETLNFYHSADTEAEIVHHLDDGRTFLRSSVIMGVNDDDNLKALELAVFAVSSMASSIRSDVKTPR